MGRLLLMFFIVASTACTRSVEELSMNVTLPVNSKNSSLSSEQLETLIVNLHNVPGKPNPWFFEFDFENAAFGGFVEIPGVPKASGILVQVLGVYEDSANGDTRVAYGGKTVDLIQASEVTVSLATQNEVGRMAEIAGRYINNVADGDPSKYPTGLLVGYYKPPSNAPRMKVWKSQIVSGWFNAIALEESSVAGTHTGLDFVVERLDGTPLQKIFSNLHFKVVSGNLKLLERAPDGTVGEIAMSAYRVAMSKPSSFRTRGNGELEVDGERLIYLGFFGNGAGTAAHKICYPNTVNEGLRRSKLQTSPGVYEPLDVDLTTSDLTKVTLLAGGVAKSFSDHYSYNTGAGACSPANSLELLVRHQHLANNAEDAIGIKPPFKDIGFLKTDHKPIKGSFSGSSATLKWQTLPGVTAAEGGPIQGFDLLYRLRSNSSDEDDGSKGDYDQCMDLFNQGFNVLAENISSSTQQHSFTSVAGTAVSSSNWTNYDYAVCAYMTAATGRKVYLGNYIRSSCLGSHCNDVFHMGWANEGAVNSTYTGGGVSSIGGGQTKVTAATALTSPSEHLVKLNVLNHSIFIPGDEVLFVIQSEGVTSSCGTHEGENLSVGQFHSTRIISAMSGAPGYIKVPKEGWLNAIIGNANLSVAPDAGASHCFIQAIKVPHFRTLAFASGAALTGEVFDFDTAQGGAVAFRVNGELDMSVGSGESIDVSQRGFRGGGPTYIDGASHFGDISVSVISPGTAAKGGLTTQAGAGGAGAFGDGGATSLFGNLGGTSPGSNSSPNLLFGGGGGAGQNGTIYGGATGGGWIFVAAEKYIGPSTGTLPVFDASGASTTTGAASVAGGGGGGSVNIFFKSSQGKFELAATGGSGGDNNATPGTAPGAAGNGGGGAITAVVCDANESGATSDVDIGWYNSRGINTNTADGSQDGSPELIQNKNSSGWDWFCKN